MKVEQRFHRWSPFWKRERLRRPATARVREQEARNRASTALRASQATFTGQQRWQRVQSAILDVLTSIRHRASLDQAGQILQRNANRHMLGSGEMYQTLS